MLNPTTQYLSTAQVARQLGLSVGTVQKLVDSGDLVGIRTKGGHRRIYASSFESHQEKNGYMQNFHHKKIGIFLYDTDIESQMLNEQFGPLACLMTHPLELMAINEPIHALFIDAKSSWLSTLPQKMMNDLNRKYRVYMYNADSLADDSPWRYFKDLKLISKPISMDLIEGFCIGSGLESAA